MKAAITIKAGPAEVIEIQEVDKPKAKTGWILETEKLKSIMYKNQVPQIKWE